MIEPGNRPSDDMIQKTLREMVAQRAPNTLCPSEVARALAPDWRALMPDIRRVAGMMPMITATQKGAPVDPETARGPIRLGWKPQEPG